MGPVSQPRPGGVSYGEWDLRRSIWTVAAARQLQEAQGDGVLGTDSVHSPSSISGRSQAGGGRPPVRIRSPKCCLTLLRQQCIIICAHGGFPPVISMSGPVLRCGDGCLGFRSRIARGLAPVVICAHSDASDEGSLTEGGAWAQRYFAPIQHQESGYFASVGGFSTPRTEQVECICGRQPLGWSAKPAGMTSIRR
jgi:hypothetical protein